MSTVSTFGAFTTARLGIYSSSKWLDVIGNNISNINTPGYTRQSVDQISLYMGGADKYRTAWDMRVGNGGMVTRVTQLRDPYMDIRYRSEISSVGAMDAKLNGLKQIANILDEVAAGEDEDGNLGVLELQFNDLISQVQRLVDEGAGDDTFDTNVRTSAASICTLFNSYASRLTELYDNMEQGLSNDVKRVNEILVQIRELSDSIHKSNIYGGDALEQKDERNLLIDELAEYVRIDVKYELEDLGPGQQVEKLVISLSGNDLNDSSTNQMVLVDGNYCAQLAIDHPVRATDGDGNELFFMADGKTLTPDPDKGERAAYMNSEGLATDNVYLARREYNEGYGVVLSTLRDRWNRTQDVDAEVQDKVMEEHEAADPTDPAELKKAQDAAKAAAEKLQADAPTDIIDGKAYKFEYTAEAMKDGDGRVVGYQVVRTASFKTQELTDNALYGAIQSRRELLTEQGEYCTLEQLAVDKNANTKRGIPYYQKALDTLANQFAATLNQANQYSRTLDIQKVSADQDIYVNDVFQLKNAAGNVQEEYKLDYLVIDGAYYFDAVAGCTTLNQTGDQMSTAWAAVDKSDPIAVENFKKQIEGLKISADGKLTKLQKEHLLPTEGVGMDHGIHLNVPTDKVCLASNVLFSNHGSKDSTGVPYDPDDPTTADNPPITAASISISKSWSEGSVRIIQSTDPDHPSTDNSNLRHILHLLQVNEFEFRPMGSDLESGEDYHDPADRPATSSVTYKGTFQKMFTDNICGHLASDFDSTDTMLNNYMTAADELYVDRDAVMGVDLNDETMNMMQVQKSLTAAYRLMTVIDDMLDRLINNTGRVGL